MVSSQSVEVDVINVKDSASSIDIRVSPSDETSSLSETTTSSNITSYAHGTVNESTFEATDRYHVGLGSSAALSQTMENPKNSLATMSEHSIADRIFALQKSASSTSGRPSFTVTSAMEKSQHSPFGAGTKKNYSPFAPSNYFEINKESPCDSLNNSVSSFSEAYYLSQIGRAHV